MGFEPTRDPKAPNGFRDRPVQPLRHPSGFPFAGESRSGRLAVLAAYQCAYQWTRLHPRYRMTPPTLTPPTPVAPVAPVITVKKNKCKKHKKKRSAESAKKKKCKKKKKH